MENKQLLSTDNNQKLNSYIMKSKTSKNYIPSYRCYVCLNIMIFCIFIMFIFMTTYLILLGKYAQELNLFNINVTETQDYIGKFKIIINNVCDNFINCTLSS